MRQYFGSFLFGNFQMARPILMKIDKYTEGRGKINDIYIYSTPLTLKLTQARQTVVLFCENLLN